MDAKVVKVLHDAFRRAIDDPVFVRALDRVGMTPYYMGGDDYLQWARRAADEERRAVERLGLKP
jgi:hypothetical protein